MTLVDAKRHAECCLLFTDVVNAAQGLKIVMRLLRRVMRSHIVSRVAGWSTARLISSYLRTLQVHMTYELPECHYGLTKENCIYCTWHENLFLSSYVGAYHGAHVLVSESRDGAYLGHGLENLGFGTVRGSSTRGAVRALRQMVRSGDKTHVAITPDGPRGPRQHFQQGAVYLASRTGMPLVPVAFAFDRPWRFRSWDRMVMPRPFSRAVCYGGTPIHVPQKCKADGLALYQQVASDAMHRATEQAEQMLQELPRNARVKRWGPGKQLPENAGSTDVSMPKAA